MLYIYHSSPLDKYRVTVVAQYNVEEGRFHYSTARCGRHDHFARKKGVLIATGRLRKHRVVVYGGTCTDTPANFMAGANLLASFLQKHSKVEHYIKVNGRSKVPV